LAIDELYMEACCQQRFQQRKDIVLDILRKELENLTLGTSDEDGGGGVTGGVGDKETATVTPHAVDVDGGALGAKVARWRRNVWELMEKPQSSLSARVSHCSVFMCHRVAGFSALYRSHTRRYTDALRLNASSHMQHYLLSIHAKPIPSK